MHGPGFCFAFSNLFFLFIDDFLVSPGRYSSAARQTEALKSVRHFVMFFLASFVGVYSNRRFFLLLRVLLLFTICQNSFFVVSVFSLVG
jgi:hypothetical protein